jgi:endonuclease YncB( thermonuclease family)
VNGTEWKVERIVSVTDGDTVRLQRSRTMVMDAASYQLIDSHSVPIRLVWVDTPERGEHPGWENARADLTAWISAHWPDHDHPLRVVCYESAGWDRLLGDLIDADGNSASQWLMIEKGWPPYHA